MNGKEKKQESRWVDTGSGPRWPFSLSKRLCGRGGGEQRAHVQGSGEALSRAAGYGALIEPAKAPWSSWPSLKNMVAFGLHADDLLQCCSSPDFACKRKRCIDRLRTREARTGDCQGSMAACRSAKRPRKRWAEHGGAGEAKARADITPLEGPWRPVLSPFCRSRFRLGFAYEIGIGGEMKKRSRAGGVRMPPHKSAAG